MSEFSGKCDFCDTIGIFGLDYIKNSKIYLNGKLLELKTIEDCIPYYTHTISCSIGDKTGAVIYLSSYSWLREERNIYGIMSYHNYFRKELNEELEKFKLPKLYTDEECKNDFWSKVEIIGNLYKNALIIKDWKNDTYIYRDDKNIKYLIRTIDNVKGIYIIAQLDFLQLSDMIEDKLTLEESFRAAKNLYISSYNIAEDSLNLKKRDPLKISKKYLPKPGIFLSQETKAEKNELLDAIS